MNAKTSITTRLLSALCMISIFLLAACDNKNAEQPAAAQSAAKESVADATATHESAAEAVGEDAINEADYRRHIEVLASDEFGGSAADWLYDPQTKCAAHTRGHGDTAASLHVA